MSENDPEGVNMLTPDDIQLLFKMKLAIAGLVAHLMDERGIPTTHTFEFLDCSYDVIELIPECWVVENHVDHKQAPYEKLDRRISNDHPDLN